jgi:hypothetical protein
MDPWHYWDETDALNGGPCDMKLGVQAMPAVLAKLREIGTFIVRQGGEDGGFAAAQSTPVKIDGGDAAVFTAAAPLVVHCGNSSDCTKEVQSALDRGPTAGFILIPNTSKGPWQVEPLFIHRGGFTLTLASGVVLLAKKGSFHKADASLLTIEFSSDVTILAQGATVKMRKLDYLPPQYVKAEWRMGVKIMGCNNVSIVGLRVQDAGGDGVYIGSTWQVIPKPHAQNYSSNVLLDGVVADGSWRNGLSVISAINLTVRNSQFKNTNGTNPQFVSAIHVNAPVRLSACVSSDQELLCAGLRSPPPPRPPPGQRGPDCKAAEFFLTSAARNQRHGR